jgi:hypothetical protein
MREILKDVAEFLFVVGLVILRIWFGLKRVEERRGPAVTTLFGKDEWWRRG